MIALLNRFIIQKHVYYENELCYSIPDFIVIKLIFNIKGFIMYSNVQPFINSDLTNCFQSQYTEIESLLFNLLDSPVKYTKHIGGTHHFKYSTEPILDILVGVENLHDITSLDENA